MKKMNGDKTMISPAIHLPGTCNEAIHFYEKVFNATNKDIAYYHDAPSDPGFDINDDMKNQVMHASLTICGTPVNFSDSQDDINPGNMICLNVFFDTKDEVCRSYDMLKEGGKVIVELGPQFFSPMYGSIEDRYGVKWQLITNFS
jgi:PhnB protein